MSNKILYQAHPVMFRNNPLVFIGVLLICVFLLFYVSGWFIGVGILFFLGWWLKCQGSMLTITDDLITLQTGILSRHISDIRLSDVCNIRVSQNVFQRIFGVGSLYIGSAATGGYEISISGILRPQEAREIIERHR